jgi:hypothetical protein
LEEAPNSEMNNIHGHSPVASFKQANFKHWKKQNIWSLEPVKD